MKGTNQLCIARSAIHQARHWIQIWRDENPLFSADIENDIETLLAVIDAAEGGIKEVHDAIYAEVGWFTAAAQSTEEADLDDRDVRGQRGRHGHGDHTRSV